MVSISSIYRKTKINIPGSSTGNLPLYTKVSPAKLKLLAIEALTILRPLIKESYELSIGIIAFFGPQNTIFPSILWDTKTAPSYNS